MPDSDAAQSGAGQEGANQGGAGRAAAGIGLSRLSGLARAMLVTNVLGVGAVGDAFAAALRIPNMLQNLLGEGALSAAFTPSYSKLLERDKHAAGQLAAAVASFLLAVVTVAVLVGVLAARPITRLIAWGFEGERFELAVQLVRITAIGAGVLVIGAWCVCVLNTHQRFFVSYVAPVIWNVTQVAVLIFVVVIGVSDVDRATALAWAVTGGAIAQVLFSVVAVRRANEDIFRRAASAPPSASPSHTGSLWQYLSWRQESVRGVLRRLAPAVAGRGAFQISAFADLALASLLAVGATAALAAAQALYLLPLALVGVAVAAVELPALSRIDNAHEAINRTADRLTSTAYLVSGAVVLYLAAGVPLADTLFNLAGLRDVVGIDDITLIAVTLGVYSLGLPAIVASRLCQNVLYADGDTRSPAGIAVVRVSLSAAIGLLVMFPFDRLVVVDGSITGLSSIDLGSLAILNDAVRLDPALPARLGAVGLALGAAFGAWVELVLLRRAVLEHRRRALPNNKELTSRLIPPVAPGAVGASGAVGSIGIGRHIAPAFAALAAGIATAWTLNLIGDPSSLLSLIVIGGVAGGVHLGLGLVLKLPAARQLASLPIKWMRRNQPGQRNQPNQRH